MKVKAIEMKAPRFVVIPSGKDSIYQMMLRNEWKQMEFNDWLSFWRDLLVIKDSYTSHFHLGRLFESHGLPLNEHLELGEQGFITEPLSNEEHSLKIFTTISSDIVEKKLTEYLIRLDERQRWEKLREQAMARRVGDAGKEHDATEDLPAFEESRRELADARDYAGEM
jgi:hypothetical protein